MQLLMFIIVSCAVLWPSSVCSDTKPAEVAQAALGSGQDSGSSASPDPVRDVSKQQGIPAQTGTLSTAAVSNFQPNQPSSNNAVQPAPYTQPLTASPELSFTTGYTSSSPYNFNYLSSSPLLASSSSATELFGVSPSPFIVNQPLAQSFAGQHDLTGLAQTAAYTGLYPGSQLFNADLSSGLTKYLQPEINLNPQPASAPAPFQFKTAPLVNTQIYHPRVTSFNTPPRYNTYLNPMQFSLKPTEPQPNEQQEQPKQQNSVPVPHRPITYRLPALLQQNRQPIQKNVHANQFNIVPQQQNEQQNVPPQRYYIRRKPQHVLDNQRNTEQQNHTPQLQNNYYNQQANLLHNRKNRLLNQPNHLNLLPNNKPSSFTIPPRQPQNIYNSLPVQQNTYNVQNNQQNVPVVPQSPPTPPRFYSNFKPMLPQEIPVSEPVAEVEHSQKETDEEKTQNKNEQEQEENEEASNENQEENSSDSEEVEEEEEEVKPKYRHRHNEDDDRDSYRREKDDDEDEEYEENRDYSRYSASPPEYSKLFSKHRYPKEYNFVPSYLKHHRSDIDCHHKDAFRRKGDNPDVKVKMYKYTKSVNEPDVNESIEGKESESIPVIQHRKKSYKEHWVITKSSKSME